MLLALVGFGLPVQAEPAWTTLSDEEQKRVEEGDIIVRVERGDIPLRHFLVTGLVEAPAAKVYRAFSDFDRYSKVFKIKESHVTRQDGNLLNVRAIVDLPWPIGERWVLNETKLEPENYAFSYRRIDGSILEYTGSLRIAPRSPRSCQVYYIAKGDLGIPFLPRWLVEWIQASTLPDTIRHVRAHVRPCCGEEN